MDDAAPEIASTLLSISLRKQAIFISKNNYNISIAINLRWWKAESYYLKGC
jgi:hypothetical protein